MIHEGIQVSINKLFLTQFISERVMYSVQPPSFFWLQINGFAALILQRNYGSPTLGKTQLRFREERWNRTFVYWFYRNATAPSPICRKIVSSRTQPYKLQVLFRLRFSCFFLFLWAPQVLLTRDFKTDNQCDGNVAGWYSGPSVCGGGGRDWSPCSSWQPAWPLPPVSPTSPASTIRADTPCRHCIP